MPTIVYFLWKVSECNSNSDCLQIFQPITKLFQIHVQYDSLKYLQNVGIQLQALAFRQAIVQNYDHAQLSRATLEYEVLSWKYDVRDVSTNADFAG